jgi:uroporphyrinogen-III synthase
MPASRQATPGLIWVTRAQPGADATAARLTAAGLRPLVAPLLETHALAADPPELDGVDALAFTSANGVRAFAALASDPAFGRDLAAFCVGGATAAAAQAAGFTEVVSAEGDVAALAARLTASLPAGARVLHPGATETAGDLATPLAAADLQLTAVPLYVTRAAEAVPAAVVAALAARALDALLVHSPKAGRAAAALLAPLDPAALGRLKACAISEAALAPLRPLPFTTHLAAATPDEAALLALLTS